MSEVKPISKEQAWLPEKAISARVLIPVIRLLQLAGIPLITGANGDKTRLGLLKRAVCNIYCLWFHVFCWLYAGYTLFRITRVHMSQSEWIIMFYVITFNTVSSTFGILAMLEYRQGPFLKLIKQTSQYEKTYGVNETFKGFMKRRYFIFALLVVGLVACPLIIVCLGVKYEAVTKGVFLLDESCMIWNYILFYTDILFITISICSTVSFVLIGYFPLYGELKTLNDAFGTLVHSSGCQSSVQLSGSFSSLEKNLKLIKTIVRHDQLVDIIACLSDCCKNIIMMSFFVALPLNCVNLYMVMTYSYIQHVTVIVCAFLFLAFTLMVIICFIGIKIHSMAHQPLQFIWKMRTGDLSEEANRNLTLFSTKLTGTSIGINVYGLFTITGSTVITILGTALTYLVVVLQFKSPGCSSGGNDGIGTKLDLLIQLMQNHTAA